MLRLDLSEDTGRGAVVLRAVGEVDIASAPELEDSVNRALTFHRPLVLDLERISFTDASGLRVLALANRLAEKMGAPLTLLRPSRQVLRVLAITGMLDTFVAAMIIGHTRDVARFTSRDRFAAYCGTAPVSFESAGRSVHRLSLRGNREMNHAMHIIAVTQIAHRHSPGRDFYDRKLAEGKTPKEALRALKRRSSDVVFAQLRTETTRRGPGGQAGATDTSSAAGLTPQQPALRKNHSRTTTNATTPPPSTPRNRRRRARTRS